MLPACNVSRYYYKVLLTKHFNLICIFAPHKTPNYEALTNGGYQNPVPEDQERS